LGSMVHQVVALEGKTLEAVNLGAWACHLSATLVAHQMTMAVGAVAPQPLALTTVGPEETAVTAQLPQSQEPL